MAGTRAGGLKTAERNRQLMGMTTTPALVAKAVRTATPGDFTETASGRLRRGGRAERPASAVRKHTKNISMKTERGFATYTITASTRFRKSLKH